MICSLPLCDDVCNSCGRYNCCRFAYWTYNIWHLLLLIIHPTQSAHFAVVDDGNADVEVDVDCDGDGDRDDDVDHSPKQLSTLILLLFHCFCWYAKNMCCLRLMTRLSLSRIMYLIREWYDRGSESKYRWEVLYV